AGLSGRAPHALTARRAIRPAALPPARPLHAVDDADRSRPPSLDDRRCQRRCLFSDKRDLRPRRSPSGRQGSREAAFRAQRHRPGSRRACPGAALRSEEHTSELQSRENLVCRLLLEKKKKKKKK